MIFIFTPPTHHTHPRPPIIITTTMVFLVNNFVLPLLKKKRGRGERGRELHERGRTNERNKVHPLVATPGMLREARRKEMDKGNRRRNRKEKEEMDKRRERKYLL